MTQQGSVAAVYSLGNAIRGGVSFYQTIIGDLLNSTLSHYLAGWKGIFFFFYSLFLLKC
jgi:hypothetical protein